MAANDVILLSERVEASRTETAGLSASEQETYFFAKHYLKEYSPNHDDLLAGVVDGSNDGGFDGIYIFVNGNCVRDDVPLRGMGYGAELQLVMCQVKNTTGFGESAVDKVIVHLPELLDFGRDEKVLSRRFNPRVIEITRRFLDALQQLDMPELSIYVAFASLRAANGPHPNVSEKRCGARGDPSEVLWHEHASGSVSGCSRNRRLHEVPASEYEVIGSRREPDLH